RGRVSRERALSEQRVLVGADPTHARDGSGAERERAVSITDDNHVARFRCGKPFARGVKNEGVSRIVGLEFGSVEVWGAPQPGKQFVWCHGLGATVKR